jgi:hypothetical protein
MPEQGTQKQGGKSGSQGGQGGAKKQGGDQGSQSGRKDN